MVDSPVIGSNRKIDPSGRLGVYKQDFNAHWEGGGFKHTADSILMNPSIGIGDNVQQTLENLLQVNSSEGNGFVSIGIIDGYADGYADGYVAGSYNVTAEISFAQAFAEAITDARLTKGGIIFVLAGHYIIDQTITVPAGISIMGELSGTFLIGETLEQPLFSIEPSETASIGAQIALSGGNSSQNIFFNINIFDNLNGSACSISTVPMVEIQNGANVVCDKVSFFGKLNSGSKTNRIKTYAAIASVAGASQGTSLEIKNCYFDGLRTPIIFTPQLDDTDFFTVSNSRFRFFGKETEIYDAQIDCCFKASVSNISITNNYIVSEGANAKTLLTLVDNSDVSNENYRILISGNNGNVIETNVGSLIDNQSTFTSLKTLTANNNWGINNESSWYLTVSADGSFGDLVGEKSLDTALLWANELGLKTTIIVNPGTYTLNLQTSSSKIFSKVKLIGNKNGRNYPIVQLDIDYTTRDQIGNKFAVIGNYIESLYFTSLSEINSIRPSFDATSVSTQNAAHLLTIKDCVFVDCSLNIMDAGSGPFEDQNANFASSQILVENCSFYQTGDYTDNISLVCPRSNFVKISNCYFSGIGYAMNVGRETYSTAEMYNISYIFENVTCDLTNKTIAGHTPGNLASDTYVVILDTSAKVTINNCQFFADNTLGSLAPISSILLDTDQTFTIFIKIQAKDIYINNSIFNGPNQTFESSSNDYALPCLQVKPFLNCVIENTKICSGGLPLQIIGLFSSILTRGGIKINNCSIFHCPDSITQTLVDIDLDPSISGDVSPNIIITNNDFVSRSVSNPIQIKHEFATGSNYNSQAFVQIYSRGFDVNFSNNKIYGKIYEPTVNVYDNFAGLFVNTFDSDSGSVTNITSTNVSNNSIQVVNNYSTAVATENASCLQIKSSQICLNGNQLMMDNEVVPSASFIGCLVIDGRSVVSEGDANINGCFFSRNKADGTATNLFGGYVKILSTTDFRGQITNNAFSSSTYDGSSTSLISDNTIAVNNWWSEGNKNQNQTLIVRGNQGNLGIKGSSDTYNGVSGKILNTTLSNVGFVFNSSSSTINMDFSDTNTDQTGIWSIPLYQIVPHGAYIVSISVDVDVSINPTTTSVASLILRNTSTSSSDTSDPLTTAGDTLVLNPTKNEFISSSFLNLTLELSMRVFSSVRVQFTAGQITIVYSW